ncbi:tetratricopeptide repeat protein [Sphingomonas sp. HDW15A]|uniref:tetratricopeptide repeat protein n=1 Tax=Sphingomonas sp. HDW15A TaxID=2714942 RepID=UPI00140DA3A5|nr:tetratricopeptide repeat protein [Sphingomonas sp. HDW15A]QIK96859.1 tetratricopeptide repeat protein [Sphingomonas sp. HDW15A]
MIFLFAAAALVAADCPTEATTQAAVCKALVAQKNGQFAASATEFETAAIRAKPGDPAADRMLAAAGNMWIAANEPAKAAVALDKALAGKGLLADQRGNALLDRARAAEAQNDLKTARARLTEALPSISEDSFAWYFSAALAVRENDLKTAEAAILKAMTLAPNDSEILFEAGHIAQLGGDEAKARGLWQRATAANPNGPGGTAAKKALDFLDRPAPNASR